MMDSLKIAIGVAAVAVIGGSILSQKVEPPARVPSLVPAAAPTSPGFFDGLQLQQKPKAEAQPSDRPATAPVKPAPSQAAAYAPSGASMALEPDKNGHFHAETEINGRRVTMLVDTGATIIALTAEDAMSFGIRPFPADYKVPISTANGMLNAAETKIPEVRVGNVLVRDVSAVVLPQGVLRQSLLGMSFLKKLGGFEFSGGRLLLRQ